MARHNRDIVEEANLQQLYDCAVAMGKCGYYPVCPDRYCGSCPPSYPNHQPFNIHKWDWMADEFDAAEREAQREIAEPPFPGYDGYSYDDPGY